MEASEFDIHTHTIASGHASTATITDMAKAAASRNLNCSGFPTMVRQRLAVADHLIFEI